MGLQKIAKTEQLSLHFNVKSGRCWVCLFVSSFETNVIEKDDSQSVEAGLIGRTTNSKLAQFLDKDFFV